VVFLGVSQVDGIYDIATQNTAGDEVFFSFGLSTLQDYAGGDLCTLSTLCTGTVAGVSTPGFSSGFDSLNSPINWTETGAFTLAPPSATPEPSTLVLFGTGLLGAVGTFRRKLVQE
jgi:hypothetical protein